MPDISDILRLVDREIWLLTSADQERQGGMIATFVNQASIVPEAPRTLVGIGPQHHTWQRIEASRAFTLHLLDESHLDWVWRFGLANRTGGTDKFAGLEMIPRRQRRPRLPGCRLARLPGRTSMDTGDRTIYLAEVLDSRLEKATQPLTLKRLLQLAPPEHCANCATAWCATPPSTARQSRRRRSAPGPDSS